MRTKSNLNPSGHGNMNILDELVAKGVSGEVIVRVAKLIADAEQTERIRSAARERMRAVRERSRTLPNVQNSSEHDAAFLSKEGKNSTKEEIKKETKKESRQKAKTALAPDWQPVGPQRDPIEAEEFRDHARAKGYRYSDWNAAYRNYQRSPYNPRNKNGAPQPAADLAAGQAEWERYRQEQIREQLNGKQHEPGIRQNPGVGQARASDQSQLRPEGGRTHGKAVECRQVVDAISSVARHLRN